MCDLSLSDYEQSWIELNKELDGIVADQGLGDALRALHRQQTDIGFIREDLIAYQRYVFNHPSGDHRFFSAQYNPNRARRFDSAGGRQPPPGIVTLNDGCFLCPENIYWQQRGKEIGYDLTVDRRRYVVWTNPFPILPNSTVIASLDHTPQSWSQNSRTLDGALTQKDLGIIVSDLLRIAARLPGWLGFYNGDGAGASIPQHFHYQFLPRPTDYGTFPLEIAAQNRYSSAAVVKKVYPLEFAHWHGSLEVLLDTSLPWLRQWVKTQAQPRGLSANVIATAHQNQGGLDLYFVARDPHRSRPLGIPGFVGGMEVLGEVVFSTEQEKHQLDRGEIGYATIENILRSVSVTL